jgi:hypothetical protein
LSTCWLSWRPPSRRRANSSFANEKTGYNNNRWWRNYLIPSTTLYKCHFDLQFLPVVVPIETTKFFSF